MCVCYIITDVKGMKCSKESRGTTEDQCKRDRQAMQCDATKLCALWKSKERFEIRKFSDFRTSEMFENFSSFKC
jgi:hypothetical protein